MHPLISFVPCSFALFSSVLFVGCGKTELADQSNLANTIVDSDPTKIIDAAIKGLSGDVTLKAGQLTVVTRGYPNANAQDENTSVCQFQFPDRLR